MPLAARSDNGIETPHNVPSGHHWNWL